MKKGIIGVAGEYFVAAELSQMGIVATLTLKNTPSVDILATNLDSGEFANIQVKTMSPENNSGWRLSEKDERESTIKNYYYILANLKGSGNIPEYYIFPQDILAKLLYNDHRNWLAGKPTRKDNPMRVFDPYVNKKHEIFGERYRNNWNILGLL